MTRDIAALIDLAAEMEPYPFAERKRLAGEGYTIHEPSLEPCLIRHADWHNDSFVATRGLDAVISLVWARHPRTGAWRRLVKRLAGYNITVIEPFPDMVAALKQTGFQGPFQIGTTYEDRMTVWRKASPGVQP